MASRDRRPATGDPRPATGDRRPATRDAGTCDPGPATGESATGARPVPPPAPRPRPAPSQRRDVVPLVEDVLDRVRSGFRPAAVEGLLGPDDLAARCVTGTPAMGELGDEEETAAPSSVVAARRRCGEALVPSETSQIRARSYSSRTRIGWAP